MGSESPCDSLLAVASAKLFKANVANVSKGELKAEVSTSGCPSSMCPGQSGACMPCEGVDGYCYPYDCADGCSESPCDSPLAVASAKLFKANVSKGELKAEVSTSGCPGSMCPGQSGACMPCEGVDGYCYPYDCADGCSESPCDSLLAAASTIVLKAREGA